MTFCQGGIMKGFLIVLLPLLIFVNIAYGEMVYDRDHDGFPDQAELISYHDKSNFRLWFAYIALSQYYHPSPLWSKHERDCAGLIRFSYKEALKKHDDKWFSSMPFLIDVNIPDILSFNYPHVPILGTRIFRIATGEFRPQDVNSIERFFSTYATAYNLVKYNVKKIGKSEKGVKKGDILVFYNPYDSKMPFHTMIFIGNDMFGDPEGPRDWLLYHTGPRLGDGGVIKKVRRSMLKHHRDLRWRPIPENPFFLGYFRFKILDN